LKALSISSEISSQPAALVDLSVLTTTETRLRLQWWYFPLTNEPPVCPTLWKRLGSNDLRNTPSICPRI